MAGDWIKMRSNLWDDPRIAKMCDITDQSEATIVGGLYWLWATADQHSEDGVMPGLTLRSIDRKTGINGFGEALVSAGWLENNEEGVRIVRFEEHNGKSAKRRCSESVRKMSARDADKLQNSSGSFADEVHQLCAPREREEKEKDVNLSNANALDVRSDADEPAELAIETRKSLSCPHQKVIDLYHQSLPSCPQVREWNTTRQKYLQARWREKASSLGWSKDDEGLEWFKRFFGFVAESNFLTGKADGRSGKPPFVADLEWLLKPSNFAKVVEGKYHQ